MPLNGHEPTLGLILKSTICRIHGPKSATRQHAGKPKGTGAKHAHPRGCSLSRHLAVFDSMRFAGPHSLFRYKKRSNKTRARNRKKIMVAGRPVIYVLCCFAMFWIEFLRVSNGKWTRSSPDPWRHASIVIEIKEKLMAFFDFRIIWFQWRKQKR